MLGPFQKLAEVLPVSDIVAHTVAFSVIMTALLLNFRKPGRLSLGCLALLVGLGVEGIQHLTGRGAQTHDVLADLMGIAVVLCAWTRRPWF